MKTTKNHNLEEGPAVFSFVDCHKTYVRSHLGKTYTSRGIEALNLEIRKGEVFGLLGLNGSGKTTTMKLALGLLQPTMGAVTVFNSPAGSKDALAQIGYLPELPYFYTYLTPREILYLYGRLSGINETKLGVAVAAAIEKVGLIASQNRRIAEFSKGMLQRVGLAQAILHDPQCLLLDEPVSGLDPLAIAEFRQLFAQFNEEGKTILLCSHSISEVEKLCHRVGILVNGRLVRVLRQRDWSKVAGHLEELFIDTVRKFGTTPHQRIENAALKFKP